MPNMINEIFLRQHYSDIKKIFTDQGLSKVYIATGNHGEFYLYFDTDTLHKRYEIQEALLRLFDQHDVIATLEYSYTEARPESANDFDAWILLEAAKHGDLAVLKQAIAYGASIHARGINACTPMLLAAFNNHVTIMAFLLAELAIKPKVTQADLLDTPDSRGTTPLHAAALCGHLEATKWLLENGANFELRNQSGKLAEQVATKTEVLQLIRAFRQPSSITIRMNQLEGSEFNEFLRDLRSLLQEHPKVASLYSGMFCGGRVDTATSPSPPPISLKP